MTDAHRLLFLFSAGILGLLIGSFLNVCIFRLPRECMSIVHPRSRCVKCRSFIAWYDNFPVFSWIALGGKCRTCRTPISIRYPIVELLTGAIFAWTAYRQLYLVDDGTPLYRILGFVIPAYLSAALIVCALIDLEFQILPDEITISGILIGLIVGTAFPHLFATPPRSETLAWIPKTFRPHAGGLMQAALGALAGGGSIYAIGVLGKIVFRKEAMGFGDVKLMAFLGAFLGWDGVLLAIMIGVVVGAVYGIGHIIFTRKMGYVPFGPFLAVGTFVMIYAGEWVYKGLRAYTEWIRGTPVD